MEYNERNGGIKAWQVFVLMLLSALLSAVVVVGALLSGLGKYGITERGGDTDATLISQLLGDINDYYYFSDKAPASKELLRSAAHELVKKVGDPYAEYFTIDEFDDFQNSMNGNYKGIGIQVYKEEGKGIFVERAYDDCPAAEAGVKDGDVIIEVDGVSVLDMEAGKAIDLIAGEDGSTVTLTVVRGNEPLTIPVTRGDVYVKRIYTEPIENGIGYIRIDSFTGKAAEEFDKAVTEMLESGAKAFVFDIRDNPGGDLTTVVDICDRILPECTITTLEGKLVDPPKVYKSTNEKSLEVPYAVLINGYSASASEIFASAVQDNKAGTLIGTNTYGKGIVQTTWEVLPGEGYLKLTTDVYLTPSGEMIHEKGVAPDIELAQDEELEQYDVYFIRRDMKERDIQMKKAVELLLEKIG
ncbi:MAG: S41 family peptidase [Clostridia bacterium]|nr:S41 family peptidase [Clostridia bacterium]